MQTLEIIRRDYRPHERNPYDNGLGGKEIPAKQVTLSLKIGQLPKRHYSVVIVSIPEYVIRIGVLRGMTLTLPDGKYQFAVRTFKIAEILVGKFHMTPIKFPAPTKKISCKQYQILVMK